MINEMRRYQNHLVCFLFLIFIICGCEAKDSHSEKNVAPVNGLNFHYKIEGNGIPIMVIGSSVEQYRMFSRKLRKHFKLIYIDTRLFISSRVEKYTMVDAVTDIEGMRKYLNIDKMVVMGNSMLAIMALEYAKKYPQRVSHLIMIGISPIFDASYYRERNRYWESQATEERKQIWEANQKKIKEVDLTKLSPGKVRVLHYVANGPKRCYDAKYDATWLFEGVTVNMSNGIVDFIKSYYNYDITKNIQNVTMPVLLIVGLYDFNNPYYLWDDFKSKFNNLEYHLFSKSGHHPMLEEPERFNQILIKFTSKHHLIKQK